MSIKVSYCWYCPQAQFETRLAPARLEETFGALGSGSLEAQPIEPEKPVHKISLEFPLFQYLPLFFKSLLLNTNIKQSFIAKRVVHYLYIMYFIGSGSRFWIQA